MDKRNKAAVQMTWVRRAKPVLFVLCLLPASQLAYAAYRGALGADPVETLTFATGDWTLRFLLITLAVTPLRYLSGIHSLVRLRRMFGLFAFFHVCLHFLVYLVFDQFFAWRLILEDILERRYIMVGMLGFLSLLPLAITSTDKMLKRLGGKRWRRLHRLAYFAGTCGVIHYLWLGKSDIREPLIYILILAILLGYRVARSTNQRRKLRTTSANTLKDNA